MNIEIIAMNGKTVKIMEIPFVPQVGTTLIMDTNNLCMDENDDAEGYRATVTDVIYDEISKETTVQVGKIMTISSYSRD